MADTPSSAPSYRDLMQPAADAVASMLRGISDTDIDRPTPCPDWTLGELARHAVGTTTGLAKIGRREELGADPWAGPEVDGSDWNTVLADNVEQVAVAWQDESAWSGSVDIGSEMPAAAIGAMAYAEILLHGWDVARTVGTDLEISPELAAALRSNIDETGELGRQMGAYGPQVAIGDDASDLGVALAGAGRDPSWTPS